MSIQTQRAQGHAQVSIDHARCDACGLCVDVCKGAPLTMVAGAVQVNQSLLFGCIACGACVAVCPQDCIRVEGRDLTPEDVIPFPPQEAGASYAQLSALLLKRRSVRNFQNRPVSPEMLDQVPAAVSTTPMGIPPSDVEVLVLENKAAVLRFTCAAKRSGAASSASACWPAPVFQRTSIRNDKSVSTSNNRLL